MVWPPTVSRLVAKVATPPVRLDVPSTWLLSLKVTVPVWVPLAAVTVAVKVTASPTTAGLADVVTVVVVAAKESKLISRTPV